MKRCFIETVAKTGLFGATELVLYRIPDNTDNRDPVYGGPFLRMYVYYCRTYIKAVRGEEG